MKRFVILVLILLFHIQYDCSNAFSSDSTVKVGIYNNEPLLFSDVDGKVKGLFVDIIEYVAAKEGWQIEYVTGTWQQCLSRLEKNEIDVLGTIAFSRERDELYDYNSENLLTNWGQLFVPNKSDIKQITDVEGKKVAVLKGDIHQTYFAQLIKKFGIKSEFVETNDYKSVLTLVSTNKVDAGVVNRFFGIKYGGKYNVDKSGIIFNPIRLYFAVPEGKNIDLIKTLDKHIASLKKDENSEYYRSLNKWFGAVSGKQVFPIWGKWAIAIVLGLVAFLLIGNIVLRNRVKAKTEDLTVELKYRKQVEEEIKNYRDHLEELVKERTTELEQEVTERKQAEEQVKTSLKEKETLLRELQNALEQVKQLKGLIPICASCKKIRDDKGYWNHLESYIEKHSEAQFSHGVCEECAEEMYGDSNWYKKRKEKKE